MPEPKRPFRQSCQYSQPRQTVTGGRLIDQIDQIDFTDRLSWSMQRPARLVQRLFHPLQHQCNLMQPLQLIKKTLQPTKKTLQ